MRFLVVVVVLVACGKGDKPPPPSAGALLTQESGPQAQAKKPSQDIQPTGGRAEEIFFNQCAMCHGSDGRGNGPGASALQVKPRNYTDAAWQASVTDDDIKQIILLGSKGVGKSNGMPDFKEKLRGDPETLDGLVRIVRSFGKKQ
jgi:mono/diheme cytochrome c family protein